MGLAARIALVVLVLGGALALICSYTVLAPMLEGMVSRNLQERFGLPTRPNVELASDPPPRMLVGDFSRGRVAMGGLEVGGVRPDGLTVDLDPFEVDVLGSARGGEVRTKAPLSGRMRVEFSEESVTEIARSRVEDYPITGVELEPDLAIISSEVEVLGFPVPASVEGGLDVRRGALVFEPRTVRAFGTPLPKRLADALLEGTDFSYPLEGLPYDAAITKVEVRRDLLVLSGDVEGIRLGGSGG